MRLGLLLSTMQSADVKCAALNAAENAPEEAARVIGVQLPRLRTLLQEL